MKTTIYFLLTAAFLLTSCEVDVPDVDREAPTFAFRITGDGFDHTFQSEDDFDSFVLHLRRDYEYDFLFSGGDSGGLKDLRWLWFDSSSRGIEIDVPAEDRPNGWNVTSGGYVWYIGDREDPRSGSIIAGTFIPRNGYLSGMMDLEFFAQDFGGQSGDQNYIEEKLKIVIGNHPTEILPVN